MAGVPFGSSHGHIMCDDWDMYTAFEAMVNADTKPNPRRHEPVTDNEN